MSFQVKTRRKFRRKNKKKDVNLECGSVKSPCLRAESEPLSQFRRKAEVVRIQLHYEEKI